MMNNRKPIQEILEELGEAAQEFIDVIWSTWFWPIVVAMIVASVFLLLISLLN